MENSVLQVSGRNTFENAYKITSKSKFSTHFVQLPYHLHPARPGSGWQRSRVKSAWKNVFGKCCFFRSVLFPIVPNDSIPTIGHSDIYLFLIPIMSQVGPGSGPSGEVVSYAICVFHTGFTPCPLIPSFQPFLGGGWRRGWMGGCSAWKKCPKCTREKNVQIACVKKCPKCSAWKNVQKCPKCAKRFWLIFDVF